jgi:putative DNA primase/helicase
LWADAKQCETAAGVRGVLELGTAMVGLSTLANELDTDPYLLNRLSGTLDLRAGTLRPADPADRITKVTGCGYRPDAASDDWDAFLAAVLPDPELRSFLQRLIGVALVGKVIDHILPIFTGIGRNGKGTFVRVVRVALGPYAIETGPDIFMARDRAHPTGQLDLRGTRLDTYQETDDGRRMDVAAVKRLTGGGELPSCMLLIGPGGLGRERRRDRQSPGGRPRTTLLAQCPPAAVRDRPIGCEGPRRQLLARRV